MKQTEMILQYMRDYGSITPIDVLREFGVMRLGARICDLKDDGVSIRSERETNTNRYGKKINYARYFLEE